MKVALVIALGIAGLSAPGLRLSDRIQAPTIPDPSGVAVYLTNHP